MATLYFDCESFSEVDLFKAGTHAYAEHPSTEITVVQWALDDAEPAVLDCTEPDAWHETLREELEHLLLRDPSIEIVAHNSVFDRTLLRHYWGLDVPPDRWRDTMVKALAHGLPGGLDKIGHVLQLEADQAKDKRGKELIQLFCKPRPKNHTLRRATRETHPTEWAEFLEYSRQDIVAMRHIDRKLPSWNYRPGHPELALWHLDQRINDRGFAVDVDLAHAAIDAVKEAQAGLKEDLVEATNGVLTSASRRDQMLVYILAEYGVSLPDMKADTLRRRIEDPELPDAVKLLLAIRLESTKTSTAKYNSLVRAVSADGRLRNTMQFAGAQRTARWAGRLFQPHNMPRPDMAAEDIDVGILALKAGVADVLGGVMRLTANAVRGCIIAPPGKKLVVADLSNIEGRGLTYLAGERWKLKAFAEFDQGIGADLYKLAYARAFNISPDQVDKLMRQIGKVMELGLGYGGGVAAFTTFAAVYGLDLDALADAVHASAPPDWLEKAREMLAWFRKQKRSTLGLPDHVWVACEALVLMWRDAHPNTVALWTAAGDAVTQAIARPGETITIGEHLKARVDGAWLRVRLPSGRYLCYTQPEVNEKGEISYMGVSQYTRQWTRVKTYGGKLIENCLAGDTEVLTETGWTRLDSVGGQRVWDGVSWVNHGGRHYSGKQTTISVFGVRMTPDHRVLTVEGWRHASSCQGLDRAPCRLPDDDPLLRQRWPQVTLRSRVRVWPNGRPPWHGTAEAAQAGYPGVVRVHEVGHDFSEANDSRDVEAPGVRGVAQHGRPLHAAFTSGLAKLRGAWGYGLFGVARVVRRLLEGHGFDVPSRVDAGAQRQRLGLQRQQLHLGAAEETGQQHPALARGRDASRQDDSGASGRGLPGGLQHAAVPARPRVAGVARPEPVFDLLNCGPRRRFTVRGPDGVPFIVHNCTQAFARDIMAYNMPKIDNAGYAIVLSVHDELLTETPDIDDYNAAGLSALLSAVPPWAAGAPLAAAGFETYRYRKD